MKKNRIKYTIIICAAIAIFFSTGLKQQKSIEELHMITAIAIDNIISDSNAEQIVSFLVYLFCPQEKIESTLRIGTAENIGETRQKRQLKDDKKSLLGLEKIVIYSEEQAMYGLRNGIDILFRNPDINDTAYIAICKDKASDILNMKIKGYPGSADFIEGLIKNSIYYNFFSDKYKSLNLFFTVDTEGRNLVLPYIEIRDNVIQITGMALFNKDKMITKIDIDELKTMNLMRENNVKGLLSMQKNPKEYINYYATSKRKVTCTKEGDNYKFYINIDLKGDLVSDTLYKDLQKDPKRNDEFNKAMSEIVKNKCNDFIIKMKNEYKVDCLQLGEVAAAKYGRHTGVDWNSIVCNSEIDVNVKVKIEKTGRGDY